MKAILVLMLIAGAAVCSLASPTRSWQDDSWSTWREEARHARQQARQAREEARRAALEARRMAWEARRDAIRSRMEARREEQNFLRQMRQQKLEVEREVREAFRSRY